MKNYIILSVLILALVSSCISLKTVEDVKRYEIVEGKTVGDNPKSPNIFTFQVEKDRSLFLRYLSDRYDYVKGFSPEHYSTTIKDVNFDIAILTEQESSTFIDLTELVFNKNDPELVKNGRVKQFINITVTDENGEDALATNSFYRNIVIKYLDDLRTSFKAY